MKRLDRKLINIKPFTQQQTEPCAGLYAEIFGKPPWNEQWSFKAALALINRITNKKAFTGFFAEYGGEAVGCLLGYLIFPFYRIYYINEFFIHTEYQNLKIGKSLIEKLLETLKNKNVPWVVLLTKKDTIAEKFYKGMGFKRMIPGLSLNKRIIMCYRMTRYESEGGNEYEKLV